VDEITLQVERDEDSGWLVASWDAPNGAGGITTQGQDLRDLQQQVTEAVAAYFDEGAVPRYKLSIPLRHLDSEPRR
jgi:predicted RNase H-like HicB family nuclease